MPKIGRPRYIHTISAVTLLVCALPTKPAHVPSTCFTVVPSLVQEATARLREATEALLARRTLRETNVAPARPTEEALKKLDSSMKRNTALLRKLKQLGEDGRKALLDDIAKTNQAKVRSVW